MNPESRLNKIEQALGGMKDIPNLTELAPRVMHALDGFPAALEDMQDTLTFFFATHAGPYNGNTIGPEMLRVLQRHPVALEAVRAELYAEEHDTPALPV